MVHWGMRAGSAVNGPGSRVRERTNCGVADGAGVDLGVPPHILDRLRRGRDVQAIGQARRRAVDRIEDHREFDAGHPVGQDLAVVGPDPARAEQRHLERPTVLGDDICVI
jgi:hypothetical protein